MRSPHAVLDPSAVPTPIMHGMAGALANTLSIAMLYPLDQIRTLQQAASSAPSRSGTSSLQLLSPKNIPLLYQGIGSSVEALLVSYFCVRLGLTSGNQVDPIPEFQGPEVLLGAVSARIVEKGGRRGINLSNTSLKAKTISLSFPGETRTYDIALKPGKHRTVSIKGENQRKKEVYLLSEIGEQKTLSLNWTTLPAFEERDMLMTPQRQSRRLKSAKKVVSPGFVSSSEIR
ncbi:hypothetical protein FOZ60_016428 [Perkinsus olseni]|uniref:Uncharacterized protein n=1 Tax=Perkinsus olseni TaxID=32597 RepID=A0A7J6N3S9_PEROL|nr:hypothetical protein FOZ60_016428 [Perkinsus olseni]